MSERLPDFVAVGYVQKAHGLKGEVRVKALTDHPPRFKGLSSLQVELRSGDARTCALERVVIRGEVIYVKLAGVETREQAEALKGAYLNIKREDTLPLADGEFYHFEVIDFEVQTVDHKLLGQVEKVMDLPANAVLVVRGQEREYLIPVIPDVILNVDKQQGMIVIEPMEGLLD